MGQSTRTNADEDLAIYIEKFAEYKILVVGDMVADSYIVGRPARISREAPVLVLHHREEMLCPGGAGNVAFNLATLGAKVEVAGVIGDDWMGSQLRSLFSGLGIGVNGLIVDESRATATKTRIIGGGEQEIQQQIVRIDRVDQSPLKPVVEGQLTQSILDRLADFHAVIVSDYENGVIGRGVIESVLPRAESLGLLTTVDSHADLYRFQGCTIATPNQPEAELTLGRELKSLAEIEAGGEELRAGMDADAVLITRGNQGMSLFERDMAARHFAPTNLREVYDPTGAGDTVSAVITLAILAGASTEQAAVLSNVAAGEVVKKLGAAAISAVDLQAAT